jgi:hypothetical protein
MKKLAIIIAVILSLVQATWAKTEKFGTWIELSFSKEFLKRFEFSIIPEFRLQDDFTVDEYIFEGRLQYKPLKYLSLATSYRYGINVKKSGNESAQHVVFDVTGKTGVQRFDGSLRLRFTNDAETELIQWENFYLRPRAKIGYNIKAWKTDPYISYEFYYDFENNQIFKGRYDFGVSRKIGKYHEIEVYYRLQDFYYERNSINILGLNYTFKF